MKTMYFAPVTAVFLLIGAGLVTPRALSQDSQARSTRIDGYREFNYGRLKHRVEQWTQAIRVLEPKLRSEIRGDVTVRFRAPGMTGATALCWRQREPPGRWGTDFNLTPEGIILDPEGYGSFVFPAERFPHGPVNVRIYAHNGKDRKDIFELQLFNAGGVTWNRGIPDRDPPAAKGLNLIYADDFDGIEVGRHRTNSVSRRYPHFFMINYAIGGISRWPIDLKRYGKGSDMWVDYVQVYAKKPVDKGYHPGLGPMPEIETEAVGLNFCVAGEASTELPSKAAAGARGVTQRHWNNLPGPNGERKKLFDHRGRKAAGMTAAWSVPGEDQRWRSKKGREWGFTRANLVLQSGYIQLGGTLSVAGVSYDKYDVYVYLGADAQKGAGAVTISSSAGAVDRNGTYFYKLSWLDGRFVATDAASLESAGKSNCVIFRENKAKDFKVEWSGNLKGGWTGVSGVQIVERP